MLDTCPDPAVVHISYERVIVVAQPNVDLDAASARHVTYALALDRPRVATVEMRGGAERP